MTHHSDLSPTELATYLLVGPANRQELSLVADIGQPCENWQTLLAAVFLCSFVAVKANSYTFERIDEQLI